MSKRKSLAMQKVNNLGNYLRKKGQPFKKVDAPKPKPKSKNVDVPKVIKAKVVKPKKVDVPKSKPKPKKAQPKPKKVIKAAPKVKKILAKATKSGNKQARAGAKPSIVDLTSEDKVDDSTYDDIDFDFDF